MMSKACVGVVGAGSRMRGVLKLILEATPGVQVTRVYDPSPESVKELREIAPDAQPVNSEEDVWSDDTITWVLIGSWNAHHHRQAMAAMQAGKHIFCEKPLALTERQCLEIYEVSRRLDRRVFLGLVLRYSPHYQAVKRVLDSDDLGTIVSMEFNETLHFDHGGYIHGDWRRLRRQAGSHVLEKCCHDLDLVQWLLGEVPSRVASFGGTRFFTPEHADEVERLGNDDAGRPAFSAWQRLEDHDPFTAEKDIVDHQVAILEYPSGVRATFHTNCATGVPERRMYLCGTRGTLRADVLTGTIELRRFGYGQELERINPGVNGLHGGADPYMAAAVGRSIIAGEPPLASTVEGYLSTRTANAIDRAMETGRVIDLPEPDL